MGNILYFLQKKYYTKTSPTPSTDSFFCYVKDLVEQPSKNPFFCPLPY